MTSSEPAPQAAPGDEVRLRATTLVAGHLHPALLLLAFLDAVRSVVVLGVFAVFSGSPWLIGVVVMLFVLTMGYAIVRYVTFRYRLTTHELITNEGILHRQERRIPISRVQDLGFEQSILRRVLGIVVVSVETASGQGVEARLDSLGLREASALREVLLRQRAILLGQTVTDAPIPEYVLYRASAAELALRGLTSNRLGVILAALLAVWEAVRQFGLEDQLVGATVARLSGFSPLMLVFALFAFVTLAVLAGWLVSVAYAFLLFFNFTLTRRGDVFQRRYGLFTTHVRSLPQRKVQRVLVEQSWLRRLLDVAVLRADSAGSVENQKEERSAGGPNVVVPLTKPSRIAPLLPQLLPGLERENPSFVRAPAAVVWRTTISGAISAAMLCALGWYWLGVWALLAFLLVPFAWIEGALLLQNLGFALGNDHVVLRYGALGRYQAFVPLRKVQGVTLAAGPIDRLLGLATLTVWVAGGSPSTMPNLPFGYARRVKDAIGREAARRRFVW